MPLPTTFEQQNNELFENIINQFHYFFTLTPDEQKKLLEEKAAVNFTEPVLELFITPSCNQECEYCYLQKYSDKLYPPEFNSKELILKNLHTLLQYYTSEGYSIPRLDLFSGEIFGYPYGNEILDIILEYLDKGLKIDLISLPTNASFCFSEGLVRIMESYVAKFHQKGTYLSLSISYDGPLLDIETRPVKNKAILKDEVYLERLCGLMERNNYGFHPMINPFTIEQQIDNYRAWVELIKKYFPYKEHPLERYGMIMQLETREKGWTTPKITKYLEWLRFVIDTDLHEYFEDDLALFEQHVIDKKNVTDLLNTKGIHASGHWSPYKPYLVDQRGRVNGFLGCNLGRTLIVRLGDLAICPCHRTSYDKFILGRYTTQDNTITGVQCQNLPLASAVFVTGFQTKPKCDVCPLNGICPKYCLGANYEANQELFYPEEDNCHLQKAKMIFLYHYFKKLQLKELRPLTEAYEGLLASEPNEVQLWNSIVQSII